MVWCAVSSSTSLADMQEGMTVAQAYIDELAAAREKLVAERRKIVVSLAKAFDREADEWRQRFMNVQTTIEAIDRAITDERYIAEKGKPFVAIAPIIINS